MIMQTKKEVPNSRKSDHQVRSFTTSVYAARPRKVIPPELGDGIDANVLCDLT